nr:probable inactive receptor kinase At2g26730 [Ipomoea batatas]
MNQVPRWTILMITMLLQISVIVNSESEQVRQALVQFMDRISLGKTPNDENFGWNLSSDPCTAKWKGISCDKGSQFVKKIVLDHLNLSGILDAASVCSAQALGVLSLNQNSVIGTLSEDISKCGSLTHLYLRENNFTGSVPISISRLINLKRLVISNNSFSGELPADLSSISGLLTFEAENNRLRGHIPRFAFSNLGEFNVSNNNFSGPIPRMNGNVSASSFIGNPGLCGELISKPCPSASPPPPSPPPPLQPKTKGLSFFAYLGYAALGLIVVLLLVFGLIKRFKRKKRQKGGGNAGKRAIGTPREHKAKSEYSITSVESGMVSSSFEILSSPLVVGGLRFEDLLQAPAEMLGKGKHGSAYKVMILDKGVNLVVKRIRGWDILKEDFQKRMQRINQMNHPNVLRLVAYYCSRQEKLLAYEYLPNGSLLNLLHDAKIGWGSRLGIAATVAGGLAFMHEGLLGDKIAHGNLKSSNILMNKDMEACISEYGLMPVDNQPDSIRAEEDAYAPFKSDVYSFGVVLLELLTGKPVQTRGVDLAKWVNSVVREEWTGEVFDKALVSEGASEERMVSMLQLALKCTNLSPQQRPNMTQIAHMINSIKDDEDNSPSI